jgi:arginine-tRNA-protein transferase
MKRCISSNNGLDCFVAVAESSSDRVQLYNSYHASQTDKKDWNPASIDLEDYHTHFLNSEIQIEEIVVYKNSRLIGLLLFEELEFGISLIYHFYDPIQKRAGLGTFLILKAIELAKQRQKDFVYMGYFVLGSRSMEYKAKFRPHQVLREGQWCGTNY